MWIQTVLPWVLQYKYIGIFGLQMLGILGFPIPDDTALVFFGYLVHQGKLSFLPAWAAAALGSLSGVTLSYILGRTVGYYLLERHGARLGITHERLGRIHAWFERVGKWGLILGYFVPGVRHLNGFLAGLTELEYPVFALFAYTGGLAWTLIFMLLGNWLGKGWSRAPEELKPALLIAGAVLLVGVLVYLLVRRRPAKTADRSATRK